jgi:hypothetical protein
VVEFPLDARRTLKGDPRIFHAPIVLHATITCSLA